MLFVKGGRNKHSDAYKTCSALRSEVKAMQKVTHEEYIRDVSKDIKDNPKRFGHMLSL